MHRKFLRISDVKELWAMKKILSLHSREGNVLLAFLLQGFCILAFLKENIPLHSCNLQRLHRLENPTWILAEQGQRLVLAGY